MTAGTPPAGPAARQARAAGTAQPPRRPGLVLAVIATAQLMVVLDLTIVVVALPHIQAALGFSGSNLEWVVNAYAVAFGGLLLLGGRSGDLQGRRRILIAGLLVFSLASLLGGLATGFSRGYLVSAGILALISVIALFMMRVSRADLAGASPAPTGDASSPNLA